jgi:uncharacterized repeat protein (TIGR03803 family)
MKPRVSGFAKALYAIALLLPSTALARKTETVLHTFSTTSADGFDPLAGLIADTAGDLYGTTFSGGDFQSGTVFVIAPDGSESVLHSFGGAPNDGALPAAALTLGGDGNLYGTTLLGGANNQGAVFQLKLHNGVWQESVIYSFCAQASCADGANPGGPVTANKNGVLFGTTQTGGLGSVMPNSGTVFRLDPPRKHQAMWSQTTLYNFCSQGSCSDGKTPLSPRLLLTKSGTLYGTASADAGNGGTLYSLSTDGGGFQVLYQFGANGYTPVSGVVSDKNGVLYGALRDGDGCGTIYSFDPASSLAETPFIFCRGVNNDPSSPTGELVLVENRKGITLYGTSQKGGAHGGGALFALTPPQTRGDFWNEQVLYNFCSKSGCADGGTPWAASLLDVHGVLYGTTSAGGAQNAGTVFRFGK